MRITLAQLNPTIGDFDGNLKKLEAAFQQAAAEQSQLIVFPELYLCGYPPKDLLLQKDFLQKAVKALSQVVKLSKEHPQTGLLVGTVLPSFTVGGKPLHNAAVLVENGQILATSIKMLLPAYDVFDEERYFEPAKAAHLKPVRFHGKRLGITICEDIWNDPDLFQRRRYPFNPVGLLAKQGVDIFINLSASPYHVGKEKLRAKIVQHHAKEHGVPFVLVNQAGGNDDLIFDGHSLIATGKGLLAAQLEGFQEAVRTVDVSRLKAASIERALPVQNLHSALVLGLRDYAAKTGFKQVVLGLSGGIDSALVACLAGQAVGKENVLGVLMPSEYSSAGSIDDSLVLAKNLGISTTQLQIESLRREYLRILGGVFEGTAAGVAEENIQARIRGNFLMALSNKFGYLLLSTGNKSEMACGYCTLYGDMSGGLAVISDVPKTWVYNLARWINRDGIIIPEQIIKKAPSAELKPEQKDQDTLPPYPVLDKIIDCYVEQGLSPSEIVRKGMPKKTVDWVVSTINRNEYKRRQAAPGLKVTTKAFGPGRRMPIAAR
jgi:NAD+ synthase (glutamine-hydrolysing)